jgi:hypothetical protein
MPPQHGQAEVHVPSQRVERWSWFESVALATGQRASRPPQLPFGRIYLANLRDTIAEVVAAQGESSERRHSHHRWKTRNIDSPDGSGLILSQLVLGTVSMIETVPYPRCSHWSTMPQTFQPAGLTAFPLLRPTRRGITQGTMQNHHEVGGGTQS